MRTESWPESLRRIVFPLVLAGWGIGVVRLGLDAGAPDLAMYFGLYFVMPVVVVVQAVRGSFGRAPAGRVLVALLLTALLVWFPVNTIAYAVAQFAEWTHGRYAEDRSMPVATGTAAKLRSALLVGAFTAAAGMLWMLVTGLLLVLAPRWLRGLKRPSEV